MRKTRSGLSGCFVFVDPPSPPGFISFKHSHAGFGEFCRESRLRLPTLDLFHAATLLLKEGVKAEVVDAPLLGLDASACVQEVLARKPSHVAVRTGGFSLPQDLAWAALLRRSFKGRVLFFGPAADAESRAILDSGVVDAVVVGDGPKGFLDLARSGGLWKAEGEAGSRELPKDMDFLPVPAWDLADYRRYSFVTAQTSWGCPLACGYCPQPLSHGAEARARSAGSVASEFSALRSRYGLRFVQLRDPDFCADRARASALCKALVRAGAPLAWGCETRLEPLDQGLMRRMAEAGCLRVAFGVESMSPAVLKALGRSHPGPEFIRRQVQALKAAGILTYGLYMIGLPGETRESTLELIDFALGLDTEAASFSMAMPFPGTELGRRAAAEGWVEAPGPWRLTSCVASMRNENMDAREIEELSLLAKRRWKERPGRAEAVLGR